MVIFIEKNEINGLTSILEFLIINNYMLGEDLHFNFYLIVLQIFLLLPGGHLHSYELNRGLQVPPFWQGDGRQGIYGDSQFFPVYFGSQTHLVKGEELI